jgi:hypothetical protein
MGVTTMTKGEHAALRLAHANGHRMSGWQQGVGLRWSSCQACRMPVVDDGLGKPFGAALYRICPKEIGTDPSSRT